MKNTNLNKEEITLMRRIFIFIRTTLLGGLLVVFPFVLLLFVFQLLFKWVTGLLSPFTSVMIERHDWPALTANVLVLSLVVLTCFFVGFFVKTRLGKFIYETLEQWIFYKTPGYIMIKETLLQFFGKEKLPFSSVALVRIFETDSLMTAFVTDESEGYYTVFVPTGPNPTSGNIYHLKEERVKIVPVSIEEAMRSIIGCGAGSSKLISKIIDSGAKS
jgi:uncharacterized membrane protein